ncbi:MAG: sigma-54-dependent transcriptional regulator [Desulfomonilia bacterium]
MKSILVATQNRDAQEVFRGTFQPEYRVDVASDLNECLSLFRKKRCEFLFIDVDILKGNSQDEVHGFEYKKSLLVFWKVFPTAQIVVISSQDKLREAVMAVKAGASNYITYPINRDELRHVVESVYKTIIMKSELNYLRERFWKAETLEVVETKSPLMHNVFEQIKSAAPMKTTVLLIGETGTGKGMLAKLLHRYSNRGSKQFIHVHCGAIPDTLIESELFGHEKGAFTGADRRRLGKFEIAHNGTIFLDEVGTLTPSAQVRLLQVLQDRIFQRIGGEIDIEVDVRIIAATNVDLKKLIQAGRFRSDLYYRLSVFPIEIPPLRSRNEDVRHLAEIFLRELNRTNAKEINDIDPRVVDALARYSWPGNVRELKNLIERAYVIEKSSILTPESFPVDLFQPESPEARSIIDIAKPLCKIKHDVEKEYLVKLLTHHQGHIGRSAAASGVSTRQLNKLMLKHDLRKEFFKKKRFS